MGKKVDETDGVKVGEEPVPGMRLRCICRGHQGPIGRIAWSPCGRFIASPSTDQTIRIWDANDGKCRNVLVNHVRQDLLGYGPDAGAGSVVWSPDGETLASINLERSEFFLSNTTTGKGIQGLHGHKSMVFDVSFSPKGDKLVSSANDCKLIIWDVPTGRILKKIDWYAACGAVAWNPCDDRLAAGSIMHEVLVYESAHADEPRELTGHEDDVECVRWAPDGRLLASASLDKTIRLWNGTTYRVDSVLEGNTAAVWEISFSADGQYLGAIGADRCLRVWDVESRTTVLSYTSESTELEGTIAFSPVGCAFVTALKDGTVCVWEFVESSLRSAAMVRYTSAKIVLVGESNVGKSCLAMRLAEDRYPEDHEHGTTHGMRFWPMEAEDLHPSAKPSEGQRRDVVLWDFGGQDEYQLVHQMFLHDTTLALVLIDPTRGRAALDEAKDWNKRLEKHLGKDRAVKLLVGAKVDNEDKRALINKGAIESFCAESGFESWIETSALEGLGFDELRDALSTAIDWDDLAKTSRPELFQDIRDDIERRRKRGEIVVLVTELEQHMPKRRGELHSRGLRSLRRSMERKRAVQTVADQLATQGVIVQSKRTTGEDVLVLQLPVVEQYAGSLVIAARNNPRGVPALQESDLGSPERLALPGMNAADRLERSQERIVLECIAELMIKNGICFRHEGLLIFPSLFPEPSGEAADLPHSVSLLYDFTGAIDNIYASLIARLMISEAFGEGRIWPDRVEFEAGGEGVCGIRQIKRSGGLAHIDLFFAESTHAGRRHLFTRFVEDHLRQQGVEIHEQQAITCRSCQFKVTEDIVQKRIEHEHDDVICPVCGETTLISEGVATIRERDPESDQKVYALRQRVDEQTAKEIEASKLVLARSEERACEKISDRSTYILHLSDLHFTDETTWFAKLQWLLQDLERGDHLDVPRIDHLVVSGDFTDKGQPEGFKIAREFLSRLRLELQISIQQCVFVPGNHDIYDEIGWYEPRESVDGIPESNWVKKDDIYLVRTEARYRERLTAFSDKLFHPLMQKPYPKRAEEQAIVYPMPESGLQFISLNSCWQIDRFHRNRSSINADAVALALSDADSQVRLLTDRGELPEDGPLLRIGVWHHALSHQYMIQDQQFVENLTKAGVQLALCGDVHEMNVESIHNFHRNRLNVVGVGSFGSPHDGLPPSTPRHYNVLEVRKSEDDQRFESIRVHVRQQKKPDGPWKGYHEWPARHGGTDVPYFDIELK